MEQGKTGRLKIFFGYEEKIGKASAMLESAVQERACGKDVVIGYLGREKQENLYDLLIKTELESDTDRMTSFDLEWALERKPDLILMDDLAGINEKNSRHKKRYQDIEELLKNGIDVYTTLNVSNIESLHDTVVSITGIADWHHIPDAVFDTAHQVELIDLDPQELIKRMQKGEEKEPLSLKQLAALRELALRRFADRVRSLSDRLNEKNRYRTYEHILVCLSPAPSNAKIIRTAARMAHAFNSRFTALFVETPEFVTETKENKNRLRENQKLAEQLNATVETVYGEDVAYQIAEFARLSGITKIVLGRSTVTGRHLFRKPTLTQQLLSYAPNVDIHIIPDQNAGSAYRQKKVQYLKKSDILKNILKSAAIFLGATALGMLFSFWGFTDANIIMVYILGVLLTSIVTSHRIYSLVSSVASVFLFSFFFIRPQFSLMAYETGYPVTFVIMFLTAYITGTLAIRYKEQMNQSAKIAYRTKILFDTDRLLSKAGGKDEIIKAAVQQIQKLLERNVVFYENQEEGLSKPHFFFRTEETESYDTEKESRAAKWVLNNNHIAGATTDTHSNVRYTYFSVCVNERIYGVVGIDTKGAPLDAFERGILQSILGETAFALENEKNIREKEEAAVVAESEQLRTNLLRAISHDLRTPLTTIYGNISNLMSNGHSFDEETKKQIYSDICDDSIWLINLVENLLYATRIENGRMPLFVSTELLSDIIEEAVQHINRGIKEHDLSVSYEDDLILVKADAKLIVQVVINLVDNAVKYTPSGSAIAIYTRKKRNLAEIWITDTGNGISDEEKKKIFDKFYCGGNKIADNRRSLGLGLYLCKSIVEAHGGTIGVTDHQPHGAAFCFTLPMEEVCYYE